MQLPGATWTIAASGGSQILSYQTTVHFADRPSIGANPPSIGAAVRAYPEGVSPSHFTPCLPMTRRAMAWASGHAPCLLLKKLAEACASADFGAPAPPPSLARVTCAPRLSRGRVSHQLHFKRDFLFISFPSWGSGWLPGAWHQEALPWQPTTFHELPQAPRTPAAPTASSCRQLDGGAGAAGCLEIRTAPPAASRRGDARFVLGVVQGMNFGGFLLPYFPGPLAQGNVTP